MGGDTTLHRQYDPRSRSLIRSPYERHVPTARCIICQVVIPIEAAQGGLHVCVRVEPKRRPNRAARRGR